MVFGDQIFLLFSHEAVKDVSCVAESGSTCLVVSHPVCCQPNKKEPVAIAITL
jgi:hypothetical protein